MMTDKKLGVLGGMGPFATSVFFERLIKNTEAHKDQEHIDTVILNYASMPDRTEAILTNNHQPFLDKVKEAFQIFEQSKVSNIAIPCNTSHYFYDEMVEMTNIHIINMVRSTVQYVKEHFHESGKVAVLATDGTKQSKVYENELIKEGLVPFEHDIATQEEVMRIIYSFKSTGNYDSDHLNAIISKLVREYKCSSVILACTELSCIPIHEENLPYTVDALDVLVKESILLSGKELKAD